MYELITTPLMETNWFKFFVVEKTLLEENENLLEKARYFEQIEF
jgi:hypothetical protein